MVRARFFFRSLVILIVVMSKHVHLIQRHVDTPLGRLLLVSFSSTASIEPAALYEYVLGTHLCQLLGRKNYNFYRTLDALKIVRIPAKPSQMAKLRDAGLVGPMVNQVSLIHAEDAFRLVTRTAQRKSVFRPTTVKPLTLLPDPSDPFSSVSFSFIDPDEPCTEFPSTLPTKPRHFLPPLRMVLPVECWRPLPIITIRPAISRPIFGPDFWTPHDTAPP